MSLPYILTPEAKISSADRLRRMMTDGKVRIVPELADCMGAKAHGYFPPYVESFGSITDAR